MNAQQKLTARVAKLSTPMLKDMAGKLMVDQSAGSEIVLSEVMNALMGRMPGADFVVFCEAL